MKSLKPSKRNILIAILVLGIIAISAVAIYFFFQYQNSQRLLKNPTQASKQQSQTLLQQIEKHLELPQDEEPTIATVNDTEKLKNQEFFKKAKNGDKVVIYAKAKKAILYDPINDRIRDVAPINLNTTTPQVSPTEESIEIGILNGTETTGLTKNAQDTIEKSLQNTKVILRENATKRDYEETIIIDINGSNDKLIEQLSTLLNAKSSTLPAEESVPSDDNGNKPTVLIILGQDFVNN